MAKETVLNPQTITLLKQVTPEQLSELSEQVLEAEKVMVHSTDELDHLSNCINDFAYKKAEYDKVASVVKQQMRELIPLM